MFNRYPYTDFSQLNLDWFLDQFKELLEDWDAQEVDYNQFKLDVTNEFNTLSGKFDDLEETVQNFTSFVENYFDNLDVQQEVNNKLDDMASGGTLQALLLPLVQSFYGAPLTASLAADMTDYTRVYVYTGSEAGYVFGNWYYWNGTVWTSGGVYNSIAVATDKTLTVSDKAADAKITGDNIYNLKKNLYNLKNDILTEGYIKANGTFVSNNGYHVTDYIPVKSGESFDYTLSHATTLPIIAFYDTSLVHDSTKDVTGISGYSTGTYNVTANGFIRIVYLIALPDVYVIFRNTLPTNIQDTIDSNLNILKTYSDTNAGYVFQKVYSVKSNVINGWINSSGVIKTSGHYLHTDMIKVKSGDSLKYKLSHAVAGAPVIAYYNDAKVFDLTKSITYTSGAYMTGTYTASADGYLVFVYADNSAQDDVYVEFTEIIPDNVRLYYREEKLHDLDILLLGDSLFGNDGEINDFLNDKFNSSVNGAFGGTSVSIRSGADDFKYFDGVNLVTALTTQTWTDQDAAAANLAGTYTWVPDRLAALKAVDMQSIDLIVMDWGTNDYTQGKTIAEIVTAYDSVIDMLQTAYPTIRLLITTPLWRYFGDPVDNENGDNKVYNVSTLKEIVEAIETFAKDKRISVLNAYQNVPLSYATASTFFDTGSGVHLNLTGNEVYAGYIIGKIRTMY